MSIEEFRDDDRGYLSWLTANPAGYVINIQRSLNPSDARLHRTDCCRVSGDPPRGRTWTASYVKLCSVDLHKLDAWATEHTGSPITRCGTCQPPAPGGCYPKSSSGEPGPPVQRQSLHAPATGAGATEIRGPLAGRPMVEAWSDDYIHYERRPAEQEELRAAIRARVQQLEARPEQVLHATYLGRKHPGQTSRT